MPVAANPASLKNIEESAPPPEARRPVIGVSGISADSKSVIAMMAHLRAQGAEPVLITDHAERIKQYGSAEAAARHDLAGLDGLVVMGNNEDIDPAHYGKTIPEEGKALGADGKPKIVVETNLARRDYEEVAISVAEEKKVPLLAICGGEQRLNVLDGGTLNPYIPNLLGGDTYHDQSQNGTAPFVPVQAVHIHDGSRLAQIAGSRKSVYVPQPGAELPPDIVLENSFHHAAIDKVGENFQVAAVSDTDRVPGGIVQAIEPKPGGKYAGQFILGVQWHPEFGASDLGPKIVSSLTDASRQYALARVPEKEVAPEAVPDQPGEITQRILAQRAQKALLKQQNFVMAR